MNTFKTLLPASLRNGSSSATCPIKQHVAHRLISTSAFKLPRRAPAPFPKPFKSLSLSPLLRSTARPTAVTFKNTIHPFCNERPSIATALLRHNYSALTKLRKQDGAIRYAENESNHNGTSFVDLRRLQPFKANTTTMPVDVFTTQPNDNIQPSTTGGHGHGGVDTSLKKHKWASRWVVNLRKKDVSVRRHSIVL